MKTSEYETPFAKLHIYKNGQPMDFNIEPFDYGMFLNNNSLKKPDGLYKITVDIDLLQSGDILVCEFDQGYLQNDGGGEHELNIVGTIGSYTVGMGTADTQHINESFGDNGNWLPYDVWGCTDRGYEVHIIDDPKKYKNREHFQQIYFDIAWEPGKTDEAWDLISFVTS